jgi:hypothetical protein
MHALGVHGTLGVHGARGVARARPWRGLRVAWSVGTGWATRAVSLGVLWRGCNSWLAVEAWVSNGRTPVGFGERQREW